ADSELRGLMFLTRAAALSLKGEIAERAAADALALLPPGTEPWFEAARRLITAYARTAQRNRLVQLAIEVERTSALSGAELSRVRTLGSIAHSLASFGERELAERLIAAADDGPQDDVGSAYVARATGTLALARGDVAEFLTAAERAAELFERAG